MATATQSVQVRQGQILKRLGELSDVLRPLGEKQSAAILSCRELQERRVQLALDWKQPTADRKGIEREIAALDSQIRELQRDADTLAGKIKKINDGEWSELHAELAAIEFDRGEVELQAKLDALNAAMDEARTKGAEFAEFAHEFGQQHGSAGAQKARLAKQAFLARENSRIRDGWTQVSTWAGLDYRVEFVPMFPPSAKL